MLELGMVIYPSPMGNPVHPTRTGMGKTRKIGAGDRGRGPGPGIPGIAKPGPGPGKGVPDPPGTR